MVRTRVAEIDDVRRVLWGDERQALFELSVDDVGVVAKNGQERNVLGFRVAVDVRPVGALHGGERTRYCVASLYGRNWFCGIRQIDLFIDGGDENITRRRDLVELAVPAQRRHDHVVFVEERESFLRRIP